jgi:wyosine [tRNA(Phe)-imidazoG37] synthetase (radical SAM superfamily)
MSDDIIKKALGMGVEDAPEDPKDLVVYEGQVEQAIADMDFEYICDNLKELIAKGKEAVDELMVIAKQSQHPRAFEVIATLIKTIADTNAELMSTHRKKADLDNKSGATHSKGVANVTNNNLFVGSTAELQAFLENQKKKDE